MYVILCYCSISNGTEIVALEIDLIKDTVMKSTEEFMFLVKGV